MRNDREIAILLGVSPQDFSNRKRRGTLRHLISVWALREGVNLNVSESDTPSRLSNIENPSTTRIDRELLVEVIIEVEKSQEIFGLHIKSEKKAELIATIYEMREEGRKLDQSTLYRLMRLAS